LFAFLASAFGAIIAPTTSPCPNGAGFTVSSSNLPSAEDFLLNALHYNKNNLQSGTPLGPYFSIDASKPSSFFPNASFSASLLIYGDQARSQLIGTGTLSSDELTVDASGFAGGFAQLSTRFSVLLFPTGAENQNFRNQDVTLYFERKNVHSSPSNPSVSIANRLATINGRQFLTLWGSNGWNAALGRFEQANAGAGIDIRFELTCPDNPPPIIEGCPCESNVQLQSYASYTQGTTLRFTGTPCVSLQFA
jgi:hypothetical protein